jgi:UDP-N-acetylmuramyl tripeptide synthase
MSERPLRDLIARLEELHLVVGPVSTDVSITSAPTHDSRLVTTGGIFVAIPGRIADGATFIASAAERGAVAVLCEQQIASSVPLIVIRDALTKIAVMPERFRPVEGRIYLREAIIDFGSSGYIARFRHLPGDDILIARIKHQKEDDFN